MAESYSRLSENMSDMTRTFLLRGSITETGAVSGVIHRFYSDEDAVFEGLDMAVLIINDWLEECRFPPSGTALRTFDGTERRLPGAARETEEDAADAGRGERRTGRKESFLIRILCREHTSWQGELRWRNHQAYFRSVLEMMALLRSAFDRKRVCGTIVMKKRGICMKMAENPVRLAGVECRTGRRADERRSGRMQGTLPGMDSPG